MKQKITWSDIYSEFRTVFPRLSHKAVYYEPFGYMTISVYFSDGSKMIYDAVMKKGRLIVA